MVVESKLHINDSRARLNHWTKNAPIVYENDQYILKSLSLNSFEETVKSFIDSLNNVPKIEPSYSFQLNFEKKLKAKTVGDMETAISPDSLKVGEYTFEYWMGCPDPTYIVVLQKCKQLIKTTIELIM
ncbi:MAG: hypothetical protein IPN86_08825 [Saprospiraceae bacterium]|nr:hypothetical protein [Saprospiraceae bacterium]